MVNSSDKNSFQHLLLNSAIGFLGVLLLLLLFGLGSRLLYPTIISERSAPDPALVSEVIQLEVLNGCGVPGIATRYTGSLREFGFDVVETGNFDHFEVDNSIVISRSGNLENAQRVAQALGISENRVIREQSPEFYLDVTLVIGADFESLNL